jgi:tetratricopeptide (TPR) repeat protein
MMKPDNDEITLDMVESWLLVVRQSASKFDLVLERVKQQLAGWIPKLMAIARENRPASPVARIMLRRLVDHDGALETILEIHEHLPRQSSAVAKVSAQTTEKLLAALRAAKALDRSTAALLLNDLSEYWQAANQPNAALLYAETAVSVSRGLSRKIRGELRIWIICRLTLAKRRAEHNRPRTALSIATLAWRFAKRLARSGKPEDRRLLAQALANRANRLGAEGKMKRAIKLARKAQDILATLPDSPESTYDMAICELSMANQLIRLGEFDKAMPFADKADQRFRVLAGNDPDQYLDYSITAANTYATVLSQMGQLRLAYELSREAVDRMASLVRRHPARFGTEYATQLINLADCAGDLGEFDEALAHARKAVSQARLAGRWLNRRNWYLEGVAHANLFNLLYRLHRLGQAKRAVTAARRAFERLPESHPERSMELARALRGLAEIHRMSDKPGDAGRAVRFARKALATLRAARGSRSNFTMQHEAHSLSTLALCLENAGRLREAIQAEVPSLALRRKLFRRSAKVHRGDLAFGLSVQARRLLQVGELDEALILAEGAVEHYRTALPTSSERTAAFLADALRTLAEIQIRKGRRKDGLRTIEEGIELLRPRYEKAPDVWEASLLPLCTRYVEWSEDWEIRSLAPFVEQVIAQAKARRTAH